MKLKLLFTFALLAIAFGVNHLFLQSEGGKVRAQTAQPQIVQIPVTQTPIIEAPLVQPEISQDQISQDQISQPQITELPVAQTSELESQSEAFYYLLHPERKPEQGVPDTEEVKRAGTATEVLKDSQPRNRRTKN